MLQIVLPVKKDNAEHVYDLPNLSLSRELLSPS